jgi:hypothetical protein
VVKSLGGWQRQLLNFELQITIISQKTSYEKAILIWLYRAGAVANNATSWDFKTNRFGAKEIFA